MSNPTDKPEKGNEHSDLLNQAEAADRAKLAIDSTGAADFTM